MPFRHEKEHLDENMVMIQANLDDMNPEFTSYVTERLFEQGANDVYWIPIIMKKGRPGIMLNVLTSREKLEELENVIFAETTTLGLRYVAAACHRLGRTFVEVETPWGNVSVKAGIQNGRIVQYSPEFSRCEALAKQHNVPLKGVYEAARSAFSAYAEKEGLM